MSNMALSLDFVNQLQQTPMQSYQMAMVNNGLPSIARNNTVVANNPFFFNNEITNKLPITDQKSSGRCWAFAFLNLVRVVTTQNWKDKYEVGDLEFSENYMFFWDKFERYHRSLRYLLQVNKMENEDQKNFYFYLLNKEPMSDGGHWDMAKDLVKKYGVVPNYLMPDSYHAKSSAEMNKILTEQLRQDYLTLLKSDESVHETLIEVMMTKAYQSLVGFLGKPPTTFDYTFKNKEAVETWKGLTPQDFLSKTGFNGDDWVAVMNDPRKENPYNTFYQIEFMGNVFDRHVGWLNLPIERLKELSKATIDKKQPIWFACDVRAHGDKDSGVHHPDVVDLKKFMNHKINMTKEEKLRYSTAVPNHAMLITGYHSDDNKVQRWKIENSWGKSSGKDGFKLMTDEWFTDYVFEVIVNKEHLTDHEKELLNSQPKVLRPWDAIAISLF
jgi:bleomycin hydrolase